MTILLSSDKKLSKQLSQKVPAIKTLNNVLTCQEVLGKPDMECDILILDYNMLCDVFMLFINWIISKKIFIRNILIYNTENHTTASKEVRRLNKAMYNTSIIQLEQLLKALEVK